MLVHPFESLMSRKDALIPCNLSQYIPKTIRPVLFISLMLIAF